jgi:hypothetical protein
VLLEDCSYQQFDMNKEIIESIWPHFVKSGDQEAAALRLKLLQGFFHAGSK